MKSNRIQIPISINNITEGSRIKLIRSNSTRYGSHQIRDWEYGIVKYIYPSGDLIDAQFYLKDDKQVPSIYNVKLFEFPEGGYEAVLYFPSDILNKALKNLKILEKRFYDRNKKS